MRQDTLHVPENGGAAPVAPNDTRRLHGSIAHDIAVAIIAGRHAPGDHLANEDAASRHLGVSRSAYREAIRILVSKGLVESRPKTGTRINQRVRWNMIDPDVLAWHFEVEPSPSFITQLFELRRIVEPSAAALAAQRRTAHDVERLRTFALLLKTETLASDAGHQADLDFHHAILTATGNEALLSLSAGIGATIRWSNTLKLGPEARLERDPFPEHWDVFNAIAAGRPRAARLAMERLVSLSSDDIWRTLGMNRQVAE
ncbi:MAG: FadR/GntR family transcriptional regulator [Geminicoccaceae bacterium]